jgi:hypothetical protein
MNYIYKQIHIIFGIVFEVYKKVLTGEVENRLKKPKITMINHLKSKENEIMIRERSCFYSSYARKACESHGGCGSQHSTVVLGLV